MTCGVCGSNPILRPCANPRFSASSWYVQDQVGSGTAPGVRDRFDFGVTIRRLPLLHMACCNLFARGRGVLGRDGSHCCSRRKAARIAPPLAAACAGLIGTKSESLLWPRGLARPLLLAGTVPGAAPAAGAAPHVCILTPALFARATSGEPPPPPPPAACPAVPPVPDPVGTPWFPEEEGVETFRIFPKDTTLTFLLVLDPEEK